MSVLQKLRECLVEKFLPFFSSCAMASLGETMIFLQKLCDGIAEKNMFFFAEDVQGSRRKFVSFLQKMHVAVYVFVSLEKNPRNYF